MDGNAAGLTLASQAIGGENRRATGNAATITLDVATIVETSLKRGNDDDGQQNGIGRVGGQDAANPKRGKRRKKEPLAWKPRNVPLPAGGKAAWSASKKEMVTNETEVQQFYSYVLCSKVELTARKTAISDVQGALRSLYGWSKVKLAVFGSFAPACTYAVSFPLVFILLVLLYIASFLFSYLVPSIPNAC